VLDHPVADKAEGARQDAVNGALFDGLDTDGA